MYLDISKDFESLNYDILFVKLYNIGLRGLVYELRKSYLTECKQFVFCNNVFSTYKYIKRGVPQGSILGPILYSRGT